jgi:hypothetical protein
LVLAVAVSIGGTLVGDNGKAYADINWASIIKPVVEEVVVPGFKKMLDTQIAKRAAENASKVISVPATAAESDATVIYLPATEVESETVPPIEITPTVDEATS